MKYIKEFGVQYFTLRTIVFAIGRKISYVKVTGEFKNLSHFANARITARKFVHRNLGYRIPTRSEDSGKFEKNVFGERKFTKGMKRSH